MSNKKFDPKKLKKLNNPQRLKDIPVDYILDQVGLQHNDVFVEIGAGTAFFSIAFMRHAQPEKLYACDISALMLEWIEENVVPDYPGIYPVQTKEVAIPLDDAIADLVFMIHLHHELESPQNTLDEAYRLLKTEGKVLIIDWKKEDMDEGPPTHIRCRVEDVKKQMERSHFKDIRFSSDLEKHFWVIGRK